MTVITQPASKTYGDADPNPLTTADLSVFLAADGITATFARGARRHRRALCHHHDAGRSERPAGQLHRHQRRRHLHHQRPAGDGDHSAGEQDLRRGRPEPAHHRRPQRLPRGGRHHRHVRARRLATPSAPTPSPLPWSTPTAGWATTPSPTPALRSPSTRDCSLSRRPASIASTTEPRRRPSIWPTTPSRATSSPWPTPRRPSPTSTSATASRSSVTGISIAGGDGANYTLNGVTTADASAEHQPAAAVHHRGHRQPRLQRHHESAGVPTVGTLYGTDSVTGLAQAFDTKHVGTGKTLSVSAYVVNDGNGGNNYVVTTVPEQHGRDHPARTHRHRHHRQQQAVRWQHHRDAESRRRNAGRRDRARHRHAEHGRRHRHVQLCPRWWA